MSNKKSKVPTVYYGGQALLEGVMMKGTHSCACAVRSPDGTIKKTISEQTSVKDKIKILRLPILRGVVNFVEMLKVGFQTLGYSAEVAGVEEEEEPGKFEKFLTEKCGLSVMNVVMGIAGVLGVALALFLFMFLPAKVVSFGAGFLPGWTMAIIEGIFKIGIFVLYLFVVSRMKEIKRTFEYHGAEHKTIHCYEHGEELTVENVKKYTRYHPRCGTSFLILTLIVSILVASMVTWDNVLIRVLLKVVMLPITMGLAYELIRFAGKYDNWLTRIIAAPGKWMQHLTTNEPDASEIECAITALKLVLDHEKVRSFPEVREGCTREYAIDEGATETEAGHSEAVQTDLSQSGPIRTPDEDEGFPPAAGQEGVSS